MDSFWQDYIDSTKMLLASKVYQDKIVAHGYPEDIKLRSGKTLQSLMLVYRKAHSSDKTLGLNVNISTQPTI